MDSLLIKEAFATENNIITSNSMISSFIPIVLIMVVFYFLLLRPQQKKMKEHRNMINNLKKGDTITFGNGIIGIISKNEDENILSVDVSQGTSLKIRRDSVTEVISPDIAKKISNFSVEKVTEKKKEKKEKNKNNS